MNAAGAQIGRAAGKELLGECLWDVLPELRGSIVESSFRRAMEAATLRWNLNTTMSLLQAWFQYQVYPLPDDGIIMYARDITEARKTEEALRKSEQLAAAGRLAASIAHEINNPLEAVTNLLYLARMDSNVTGNSRPFA